MNRRAKFRLLPALNTSLNCKNKNNKKIETYREKKNRKKNKDRKKKIDGWTIDREREKKKDSEREREIKKTIG